MPPPKDYYFPDLMGYTFPAVVKILEKIGDPVEMRNLPEENRGPMRVTLASELAVLAKAWLLDRLNGEQLAAQIDELYQQHGDARYCEILLEIDLATKELVIDQQKLSRVQEQIARRTADDVVPDHPDTKTLTANIRLYYKRISVSPLLAVQDLATEYAKLVAAQARLHRKLDTLESEKKKQRRKTELRQKYRDDLAKLMDSDLRRLSTQGEQIQTGRGIRVDPMNSPTLLPARGAAYYLRNTDADWWLSFTKELTCEVERDGFQTPHKILLRHPQIIQSIKSLSATIPSKIVGPMIVENPTLDVAATVTKYRQQRGGGDYVVLKAATPAGWLFSLHRPPGKSIKPDAYRQRVSLLRSEDEDLRKWIECHGGNDHPANFYLEWAYAHRDLDNKPSPPARYNSDFSLERSRNELYWCLSRRNPSDYPFEGIYSEAEPKEFWEKRTKKWDVKQPNYWSLLAHK